MKIINDDCFKVLSTLEDNSIDAIITDPPYGILTGHKIETTFDITEFANECFRILKDDSPMVFFGLMPKAINWLIPFMQKFNFRAEVIWCKRQSASFMLPIPRIHESIYIMSKGKMNYNKIKGNYEDIKNSMAMDNLLNEECFDRRKGKWSIIKPNYKNNDDHFSDQAKYIGEHKCFTEDAKFQSVWSFAAHNKITKYDSTHNIEHPTVKPLLLMDRLIELCTFEGQLILDPFAGSGSTLLSARRCNRDCIGIEIDKKYFDIIEHRLASPYQDNLF